jgi:hypothetical protein
MTPTRRSDLPNVPWITADGAFDPAKVPIDSTLQQCVGFDLLRAVDQPTSDDGGSHQKLNKIRPRR